MLPESWDRWIAAIPQIPNRKLGKYRRHNFEYFKGRALSGLGLNDTCGAAEVREVCARYQITLGKIDFRCGAAWKLISTYVVTAVKLAKSRVGLPSREQQRLRDAEAVRQRQERRNFHQYRGLGVHKQETPETGLSPVILSGRENLDMYATTTTPESFLKNRKPRVDVVTTLENLECVLSFGSTRIVSKPFEKRKSSYCGRPHPESDRISVEYLYRNTNLETG